MDGYHEQIRDTVYRQLRPMVRRLGARGPLDERALKSIEATASHLLTLASGGSLRLVRIERTEASSRGLIVLTCERVSCQDNRP